jgi:hypothetical protein
MEGTMEGTIDQTRTVPAVFTLPELWLLNDHILCECTDCVELATQICLAIGACETYGFEDYTLLLNHMQLMSINWNMKRDARTPEGASGKERLLKTFAAMAQLAFPYPDAPEPPQPKVKAGKRRRPKDA